MDILQNPILQIAFFFLLFFFLAFVKRKPVCRDLAGYRTHRPTGAMAAGLRFLSSTDGTIVGCAGAFSATRAPATG